MKKTTQTRGRNERVVRRSRPTNPLVEAFAVRLKTWREENGLQLKRVAAKLDLSTSIVCEWEHAHRFPSVDHLWALSKLTGIPAWEFIQPVKGAGKRR